MPGPQAEQPWLLRPDPPREALATARRPDPVVDVFDFRTGELCPATDFAAKVPEASEQPEGKRLGRAPGLVARLGRVGAGAGSSDWANWQAMDAIDVTDLHPSAQAGPRDRSRRSFSPWDMFFEIQVIDVCGPCPLLAARAPAVRCVEVPASELSSVLTVRWEPGAACRSGKRGRGRTPASACGGSEPGPARTPARGLGRDADHAAVERPRKRNETGPDTRAVGPGPAGPKRRGDHYVDPRARAMSVMTATSCSRSTS